jgi:hypothetical protein
MTAQIGLPPVQQSKECFALSTFGDREEYWFGFKGHGMRLHGVCRSVTHRDGFGEELGGYRFPQYAVGELAAEVQ